MPLRLDICDLKPYFSFYEDIVNFFYLILEIDLFSYLFYVTAFTEEFQRCLHVLGKLGLEG